jgi:hypothetical protein
MSLTKEAKEIIRTLEENNFYAMSVLYGNHRAIQKSIEKVVEGENYQWQTLRVQEDGKIKAE